jgi:hypothetical protein
MSSRVVLILSDPCLFPLSFGWRRAEKFIVAWHVKKEKGYYFEHLGRNYCHFPTNSSNSTICFLLNYTDCRKNRLHLLFISLKSLSFFCSFLETYNCALSATM